MTRVAVIQSNYIPWKGYFDIIHDVDLFVFYDDVQYTKNDWRNRNKIKTAQGLAWLTVPVGKGQDRLICEVDIDEAAWGRKHWATIEQSYARAPFFKLYRDFFEHVYRGTTWTNLSALNQFLVRQISQEFLGLTTAFRDSREYKAQGAKQDRLIDLLRKVGATRYVSGPSARAYIQAADFASAQIELVFKDYSNYPEYLQLYPPFEPAVSILDVLFNCGPAAADVIWGWRQRQSASPA